MPEQWVSINGSQERGTVTISWQVAQESNNKLFEVEESKDNVLNFEKVGETPSLGDSDSLRTYHLHSQRNTAV
ncbi:hypothetical protein MM239_09975 [Belliella sp. DSM 111904]|uniref:Uncharacterized protein n=1 Tax=Belliella filtrata TaxID=2923435 RepID=A0ABS9UZZ1_9BACT|nr:hypothetical protein [Belliella filtrata]MCH7409722.1 hypothetical protein [Belliella filtrata]